MLSGRRAPALRFLPQASLLLVLTLAPIHPVRVRAADDATTSIPVAEVAARAEEVSAYLRTLEGQLEPTPQITGIERDLAELKEQLAERTTRTMETIATRRELGTLDALAESWHTSRRRLVDWVDVLTARATWIDEQRTHLDTLRTTWTNTRAAASAAGAPKSVSERITAVLGSLTAPRDRLDSQRGATLLLQDGVAKELTRCDEALESIRQARRQATGDLLARDSPPIWQVRPLSPSEVPAVIQSSLDSNWELLRRFAQEQSGKILIQIAAVPVLAAIFWWIRRRVRSRPNAEAPVPATPFRRPVAAAFVLVLLSSFWIYAAEPRVARIIIEIGGLVPIVLILLDFIPRRLRPGLYTLAAFFLVDRVEELVSALPLLERLLLLGELLAAVTLLGWLLWSGRIGEVVVDDGSAAGRLRSAVVRLGLTGFLVALVAAVIGNMSLARLLSSGILASGYLALVLYAARQLAEGLVSFALNARPLSLLRMVHNHRDLLDRRARGVLRVLTTLAWAAGTLGYFGLLSSVVAGGRRVLTAQLTHGALSISLGDILAFCLTVWAAFFVSSAVRATLEEEIFPRLRLPAGLPYALSSLARYAIVCFGFILALVVLGVNFDRITLLGGAFGVGLGFGLQNVVNNFVSGLIVLFERPVRVGDAIQIADVQGEVRRIGIRSSTVSTFEGADVIVPNSMLVAERVTNWTPADHRRRVDVRVSVAYGIDPDDVLKVLGKVARAHPDVAVQPSPLSLFLGFGESALLFELRAWTDRLDRFLVIRSELGIAVYAALREANIPIPIPQQEVRIRRHPPGPVS